MHELKFTDQHLAVIDAALQEMPHKLAYPVLIEINRQIQAAMDDKAEKTPE